LEEVLVQGHDPLHELHVPHQAGVVVGEQLNGGDAADATGVERGGVHVAALHEAEHLSCVAGDLQCLAVELTRERVERPHDVADVLVPVGFGVR
jgi:hypothetical protein